MERPKIYFASAMGRGREGGSLHEGLISFLDPRYGSVTRERVSGPVPIMRPGDEDAPKRLVSEEELLAWRLLTPAAKRQDELRALRSSAYMVAEITLPSVQLGVLIAIADQCGLPVLCVRLRAAAVPLGEIAMLAGNPNILCADYQAPEDLAPICDAFFSLRERRQAG